MAPHAVTRRDASARRTHHAAALLADARRLEPLRAAALGPFEHRQLRLAAANQPGIEQLARLDGSEEHTSELQSPMRISYAVFCLKKKTRQCVTDIVAHRICSTHSLVRIDQRE